MKRRRTTTVILLSLLLAASSATAAEAEAAAPRKFSDCGPMRAVYPGGVAKSSWAATHPMPSWIAIRTPAVDLATYNANRRLDRDGDGIACEVTR